MNYYAIYDAKTGTLLAEGNAVECKRKLKCASLDSFYALAARSAKGINKKYKVVIKKGGEADYPVLGKNDPAYCSQKKYETEILNGDFDIQTHKANFVNYLEVIIDEYGEVLYAVPSHQEKLISLCMEQFDLTRQNIYDLCPPEYYCDVVNWLCSISNCIAVWNDFYIGECSEEQINTLKELRKAGIYKGEIPVSERSNK